MSLFQKKEFLSHSGNLLDWKIDCDALTDEDIETLAFRIGEVFGFKKVIGIPTGGERLAEALKEYENPKTWSILLVDDVLTTGHSMEEARQELYVEDPNLQGVMGVVLFSRMWGADVPNWIYPIFQLWDHETPSRWLEKTIERDMRSRSEKV